MSTFKILPIIFLITLVTGYAVAQVTCDSTGNVVLYSNYDGGVLNINVDVNIPNLKIGVVSYEMVTINLTGPYVNNVTRVEFTGYTTTTHHHCNNSPAVTSIVGAPPGTDTLVFMPNSPVANANGYYIIICNYSCDTSTNQGGCNTPDQIAAYFQQEFGGLLRYHFTQYGCWNGTYNISDGGNCCVSALAAAPVAFFSSTNHICPGTCTDFINLSSNATSFEWTFAGATPPTSTDVNPAGICYSVPGSYDVTLVANGPGGTDTMVGNNYVTVYPYPPPQGILQSGDTLFANQGAVSYQWYFNGSAIAGATDYFYVITQNGDYNLIATDANGCEVETASFGLTGVNELSGDESGFSISPNPVEGKLEIKNIEMKEAAISVYNIFGEKVIDVCSRTLTLDCGILPSGIYFLQLTAAGKHYNARFIKS
jgi:PKD repeat protein